jgi:hypothetical protein
VGFLSRRAAGLAQGNRAAPPSGPAPPPGEPNPPAEPTPPAAAPSLVEPLAEVAELDPLSALSLPELAELMLHSTFQERQPQDDAEFLTRDEIIARLGDLDRDLDLDLDLEDSPYPELPFDEALAALHICGLLIAAETREGDTGYHLTRAGRVALDAGSVAVTVSRRFG